MSILGEDLAALLNPSAEAEPEAPKLEVVAEERPAHPQWAKYRPQFASALEGGLQRIEDLERLIGQGKATFFPGKNAAVIAEKVDYGQKSVFQCTWAVGDMNEILTLAPGIEAVGRLLGCSEMLVEGRSGWTKVLKPLGYQPWSVTLRKEL